MAEVHTREIFRSTKSTAVRLVCDTKNEHSYLLSQSKEIVVNLSLMRRRFKMNFVKTHKET